MSLRIWVRTKRSFTWADSTCLLSTVSDLSHGRVMVDHNANGYSYSLRAFVRLQYWLTILSRPHCSLLSVHRPPSPAHCMHIDRKQLSIASTELYAAAIGVLKISVALFYLRCIESNWQRHTVYVTTLVNTMSTVLLVVATVLDRGALPKQSACIPGPIMHIIDLSASISNAATSWCLAIVPTFIMASRAQRLTTHQKSCSGCLLLLSGCVSVLSVMRVLCVVGTSVTRETYLVPLSVLECGIATVAASAVTLQPLFRCLSRSSSSSGYVDQSGSEKGPEYHTPFVYEGDAPSKSHFSLFSEASFGPKPWFKSDRPAPQVTHVAHTQIGPSISHKPTRKISDSNQAISQPSVVAARPPPLNRTESQQYLLRNESDSSSSSRADRRHARSSKPLLMYGEGQQYI